MLFEFGNKLGWYAFLTLIPLIVIYLIRPRPTKLNVPSLMFFMKRVSSSTTQSLFRYFQNDLLFFIQLLVLTLLSFSILEPAFIFNRDVVSSNIVFVVDVSASSKVVEGSNKTRLDIAKEKIEQLATSRNSLILLKSSPIIALQDVRRSDLTRYLDRLQSTDDSSDIASAISLAGDMLADNKGRVVVVSDFIESKGINAEVSKNILESRGIAVNFVDTKGSFRNNIGIVDMIINGEQVNLYIKNYNILGSNVSLKVNNEINNIYVGPESVEPFVFNLNNNLTSVEILNKDDFMIDNKILITRPYADNIKVLLITNRPSKFLRAVLSSIEDVNLTIGEPPILPQGDFDVYVIGDVNRNSVVLDTFGGIMRKVRDEGKSAVVVSQRDIDKINFEGLIPISFGNFSNGGLVYVHQINRFTKNIDFGSVNKVFEVFNATNGTTIASVNNSSVISLFGLGRGHIAYYGLMDDQSDFKLTPGYPIFWSNLIDSLVNRGDLNEVNLKTGAVFNLGNETKTLDKLGIYTFDSKSVAVNLLNEKESDINYINTESSAKFVNGTLETIKSNVDYRLDLYLVALVLLLVIFEFVYIKFRGEI